MGYTRNTGQLSYLITYDGSGNITVPASFTQTTVTSSMLKADSSGKLVAAVAGTDFVAPAGLSAYVPTTRTITINGTSYDLSADRSWSIVSGVSSFNTRTGAITLSSTDVNEALGYIPVTNARTLTINGTTYDLSANRSWSIVAGLSSFNTRTGAITLLDTDVTGALGYTPVTNARTITINGTTYDLSANRTWTVDASSVTTRVIQKFTATASQTAFTVTGGYTVGMVDVFLNGIKLDNAVDFTATDGSVVTLAAGAAVGDIVEVYKYGGQFIANNSLRQTTAFTATAGQTTFTVSYSVGFVDVFYNGSKLAASEFTATNGTSIVLGTACVLNDIVEVVAYNYTVGAFTGVGGSGTTNYISKWTASGTLGNSLIYDNGTNIGIGTISPLTNMQISGLNGLIDSFGQLYISSTDTATINYGGQLTLGGYYNGTTNQTAFGAISGRKENSTANNILGYLSFGTQSGTIVERMRITSTGFIGINESSPLGVLHARGIQNADTIYRLEPTSNSYASKLLISSRSSGDGGIRYGVGGGNNLDIFSYGDMRFYCGTSNLSGAVGDLRMTITQGGLIDIPNRNLTKGSMPSGSIIQTIQYKLGSSFSTSSSSDQDSGLKLSITPTSSSSKILVIVSANIRAVSGGGNCYATCKLIRGNYDTGTTLHNGFAVIGNFSSSDIRGSLSFSYLDSPSTTSSVQYVVSMNSQYAATVYMDSTTTPSTITLMEIAQ